MLNNTFSLLKKLLDRINNDKLKQNLLQALPFWIASLITGIVAVVYAKLFSLAEEFSATIAHKTGWVLFILTPTCFVVAWWLVKRFAPNSKGSGIPQVMAAIELSTPRHNQYVDTLLSIKIVLVKILSSILMVFGGGAVGREGPTIQIAGSIFWKVNQLLPKNWPKISKKNMIMTGAAAGLAAAFNTPLGGIVFAVEELAKTHINYFKTAVFTAVIIAGLTAQGILGPYLYLGYPRVDHLTRFIFLYVIIVAVFAGALGTLMSKLIIHILAWKAKNNTKYMELIYAIVAGLIIASVAYFLDAGILGSGKKEMSDVLFSENKYGGWQQSLLRIIGPALTFTTGAAGGIFAPSLSAGAAVGSLAAHAFSLSDTNANLLILSGMVAFLTGVTRSPFTSAILVLEMTDRHNVIFHLLLAGIVSSMISGMLQRRSLYTHLENGYLNDVYKLDPQR
ncbi:MAG: chloride channel protein [Taibaiella sp.]|nr:chloride channel protein [Taibaiella sp.]